MKRIGIILCMALLATTCTAAMAADKDLDVQRLNHSLDQLQTNTALAPYAQAERALARQAVQRLHEARSKQRPHLLYLAERRVDWAKAAAQLGQAQAELAKLDREHDQILLEASRRDAAATQRELERERLQNQLAAENAARLQAQGEAYSQAALQAQAEAEQAHKLAQSQSRAAAAAKHEAQLAEKAVQLMRQQLEHLRPHQGSEGMQMTLGGLAFAVGQTSLRPEARQHLGKLVQFVKSKPDKHVRVEGYTDSSGNSAVNQSLSLKRAQSVRAALIENGIPAARISATGMGEAHPVASNATAEGRAKNRRVVVILEDQ